ncbi:MAG: class I SAM-dependent methyltransferase [Chloroflexota bacterium]|nr:class I SAM-dependent methyltransferase [Chloroflexota bacterium]
MNDNINSLLKAIPIIRRSYDDAYFDNVFFRASPKSQRNRKRLALVRHYQPTGRLLEIGPGTGEFLSLATNHFEVEGIEVSSRALEFVEPEVKDRMRIGNIEEMRLPPYQYDVVAAFNVLEHLRNPAETVYMIRQTLVAGGCLVGTVPCNAGPIGRSYTTFSNYFDQTHCSTFEPDRWHAIFQQAGFSDVTFFGEAPIGPRLSIHITGSHWQQISPNMMFACQ